MHCATGKLVEIYLENGLMGGQMLCPQNLVPGPGQYLLAHDPASDSPLPVPVFLAGYSSGGFLLAPPIPKTWQPGLGLSLRGPLGHGFEVPSTASRVALVAFGETPKRLLSLIPLALEKNIAVVLVSEHAPSNLPSEVEIQPLSALREACAWADYVAADVRREALKDLREEFGNAGALPPTEVLVITPMPCGGLAECGLCAVKVRRDWKMACKDGPVFDLKKIT